MPARRSRSCELLGARFIESATHLNASGARNTIASSKLRRTIQSARNSWEASATLGIDVFGGRFAGSGIVPMAKALIVCLTVGLVWQFVLVAILVGREQGTLRWSTVREALWLRSPRRPRSGRVGGRLWLIVIPLVVVVAADGPAAAAQTSASRLSCRVNAASG